MQTLTTAKRHLFYWLALVISGVFSFFGRSAPVWAQDATAWRTLTNTNTVQNTANPSFREYSYKPASDLGERSYSYKPAPTVDRLDIQSNGGAAGVDANVMQIDSNLLNYFKMGREVEQDNFVTWSRENGLNNLTINEFLLYKIELQNKRLQTIEESVRGGAVVP